MGISNSITSSAGVLSMSAAWGELSVAGEVVMARNNANFLRIMVCYLLEILLMIIWIIKSNRAPIFEISNARAEHRVSSR